MQFAEEQMNYYYINTDTDALGYSPHAKWMKYDRAFTSGDASNGYYKYGERVLGTLSPGDMLFMYVSRHGVVAAGWVCEFWDRCAYRGRNRLVYRDTEYTEYRIGVDWCLKAVHNPMCPADLRAIIGWTPISTLQRIKDTDAAERLFEKIRDRA